MSSMSKQITLACEEAHDFEEGKNNSCFLYVYFIYFLKKYALNFFIFPMWCLWAACRL